MVSPAGPGMTIRCSEQGLNFRSSQVVYLAFLELLVRHRQHALYESASPRFLQRHVSEERTDSREPDIAGTRRQAPHLFGVIKEGADQRGIKILKRHFGWRFLEAVLREPEELAKRFAIADDGVRADLPLVHKAIGKESLEKPGEGGR